MPVFYFGCPGCGSETRKILDAPPADEEISCLLCGDKLRRRPRPPTSQVVERLDNGIMPKAVERLADAERIYAERKDPRKD